MERRQQSIIQTIVQEVALVTTTDPLELPPLYRTIDPEALEAAIHGMSEGTITFDYLGYAIAVESDGTVRVSEGNTRGVDQLEPATDD